MLSAHFARREFECKCKCGFNTVDVKLIGFLELIRTHFNAPIIVNSGCRCSKYNKQINGASRSQHIIGRAADITIKNVSSKEIADYAEFINTPGVGRYPSFTHIDSRNSEAKWGKN